MTASGYVDVDSAADPAHYIERLDRVGASNFWQNIKRVSFGLLWPRPGNSLLDVGCGTGDDARSLAALVAPGGRVVGIDRSRTMVQEAVRRSEGCKLPVEFRHGDALGFELDDASFDGARAERVLQHVDEPRLALRELVRVTRPRGRVVVVDPDYRTLSLHGGDPSVTGRILETRRRHFQSTGIGSLLPRLFKQVPMADVSVLVRTLAIDDAESPGHLAELGRYAADTVATGAISDAEARLWLADVRESNLSGSYSFSVAVFIVSGTTPQPELNTGFLRCLDS
jgi:SAM-dependent methyltransferase